MRTLIDSLLLALVLAVPCFTACGDSGGGDDDGTTTTPVNTDATTNPPTTGDPSGSPTTVDPDTTLPPETSVDPPTTMPDDTTAGGDGFVFDQTPPEAMVQLDRMGMPAVATAVISAANKDPYNEATPTDDAAMAFVDDIVNNLGGLHDALDDDLAVLGLTPCGPAKCAEQAGPLVIPDTLQIDVGLQPGFPNGRELADPVIDITLAVILLNLASHGPDTFVKLPLNPPKNDKEFLPDFPYLATPH